MRFVAPLLVAVLAATTPAVSAATLEVSRTPPPVYAAHVAAQLTPVAEVMAGRNAFPDDESGGIVLLHERIQYLGDDGLHYRVIHVVQHAVEQAGVEGVGSDIYTFDREREDIFLIEAATIRPDGTRLPVEAKGAFIQTPQHEAENSLYTSEAELNVIFPHVAPGCSTEAIVLIRENQPVMPGEFALAYTFSRGWPSHRQRLVLDFPADTLARVRAVTTGSGVPAPVSGRHAPGRERREWTRTDAPYVRWEENGPQFEYRGPTLWLTTLESWDAVAAWFHGLVADRSALGAELEAEVDRWTAGLTDRAEILARLTEKVANDVRYVGLEFGLAGYQPHPCEQVWRTRYGDCKDKANLLRALLAHKGIAAHLVLIQTSGLGQVQKDCPSWRQFNHAILAVEDGDGGYTFCDPTIKYLPAGSIGLSDIGRDVLVVRGARADWARTPDTLDSAIRLTGDLALAPDGSLSGWFTLAGEGVDAAGYADHLNGMDRDDRMRWMQRVTAGFFPGADVVDIDYTPVTSSIREVAVRAYFVRDARASGDQALVFPYPTSWLPSVDTPGERRFPYVTRRREESVTVSVALPEGWGARSVPAVFQAPSDIARFDASWRVESGRLEARLAWHPRAGALAAADYPVFQRSVRALTAWLEQPVVLERASGDGAPAPVVATNAPVLRDFPILPTGAGQLRLINERYPEGRNNALRRLALEQTLQWFPGDTETTFEVRIWLASIGWDEGDPGTFADEAAALIRREGDQVTPGLRAWAVYLEAKARWEAGKDPAAITRLQQVADDRSLNAYRRGYAALFAGRYLRETDPAAALEFCLRHDDYESDAREPIVRLIALLYGQTGDATGAGAWAGELASRQAEVADELLAAALDELLGDDPLVPAAGRRGAVEAIAPVVRDAAAFPKCAPELVRWEAVAAGEAGLLAYREALRRWLEENNPDWWTRERDARHADMAALVAHLDARNDARDARAVVDGVMQLAVYYEPSIDDLAQYSRWAMWWMRKQDLATGLLDVIGRGVLGLSPESGEEVIQAWHEYALFLRARERTDEVRAVYRRTLDQPAAKDYQRVDAGGELGLVELKAGDVEAALAAFHRIVPFHFRHKWSVDYLYPAVLLHVGRGESDEALRLIEAMREQEEKYINGSDHKLAVNNLLRAARQADALRRYWARTAGWIETWDAFLTANGIDLPAAHELPLETDFDAAAARVNKAVTAKSIRNFLREVDAYARIARVVPMFASDLCTQVDKADGISDAFMLRIGAVVLPLVAGHEPVDPEFDLNARVWESIMLANAGRKDEAAACGRRLLDDLGPEHPKGMSGLRLWVLYSRGAPGEPEAVAQLEARLAGDFEVSDRMRSVRILSDTYMIAKDPAAQRTLLEREVAREDFESDSDDGTVLRVRLDELNSAARADGALTGALKAWVATQDAAWLDHVPPATLDDPHFAGRTAPLAAGEDGVSGAEAMKFNLLSALSDEVAMDARLTAFASFVIDLGFSANDVDRLSATMTSAAAIKTLPDERRARLAFGLLQWLVGRGETALAAGVAARPEFRLIATRYQESYHACHRALTIADEGAADWENRALAALTDAPLDAMRADVIGHFVRRLACAGDPDRAAALVAATKDVAVAPDAGLNLASLRLGWTRAVRRAREQAGFVREVRGLLAALPGADAPASERVRRQIDLSRHHRLPEDERLAAALFALDHGHVAGEAYSQLPLIVLGDAYSVRDPNPMLFPRILEAALRVAGTDEDRAAWVSLAAFGSDFDRPEVRDAVLPQLDQFRKSPEAARQPNTAQAIAFVRAVVALRVERDARPGALFGDLEQSDVPAATCNALQLQYYVTRGEHERGAELTGAIPSQELVQPQTFRLARSGLLAAGRGDEAALLDEAMREQLARTMPDLWRHPDDGSAMAWLPVARTLDAADLVPRAWFDRAAGAFATEVDRQMLRVHQAHLERNWPALREACDRVLAVVPDLYDTYYDRALARYQLDDRTGAVADLRVVLEHSLSHEEYQQALALYRELAPGEQVRVGE